MLVSHRAEFELDMRACLDMVETVYSVPYKGHDVSHTMHS